MAHFLKKEEQKVGLSYYYKKTQKEKKLKERKIVCKIASEVTFNQFFNIIPFL